MDFNKLFAGILCAAIIFLGTSITSEIVFKPDDLEKPAYHIDTGLAEVKSSGKPNAPAFMTGDEFANLVSSADIAKGEKLFKKCIACHTNTQGGANKVGPALWGTFDKDVASVSGYSYSKALTAVEGNWDIDNLNKWLYKPKLFAKGNKMSFAGIKKDSDRAAMIAYLKTLQ